MRRFGTQRALHTFNRCAVTSEEGITIDEALILLAQMRERLRRLEPLRAIEPKKRVSSGCFGSTDLVEYEYANFDVKKARTGFGEIY